jgi:hypothetical protein
MADWFSTLAAGHELPVHAASELEEARLRGVARHGGGRAHGATTENLSFDAALDVVPGLELDGSGVDRLDTTEDLLLPSGFA